MGNVAFCAPRGFSAEARIAGVGTSGTEIVRAIRPEDLGMETLADVLRGNILVHNHCYRADEMARMIDIARSSATKIRSFHHGVRRTRSPIVSRGGRHLRFVMVRLGRRLQDGKAIDGVRADLAVV